MNTTAAILLAGCLAIALVFGGLGFALAAWARRRPPPHYTEPPLTDADRDARLAKLVKELER